MWMSELCVLIQSKVRVLRLYCALVARFFRSTPCLSHLLRELKHSKISQYGLIYYQVPTVSLYMAGAPEI